MTISQINNELIDLYYPILYLGTGKIYCFGDGQYGQLGVNMRPTQTYLSTPCNVPIPSKVVQVDCGIAHTAAVTGTSSS